MHRIEIRYKNISKDNFSGESHARSGKFTLAEQFRADFENRSQPKVNLGRIGEKCSLDRDSNTDGTGLEEFLPKLKVKLLKKKLTANSC